MAHHYKTFQGVAEDGMMGWLMSMVNASFVHVRAFLPIRVHSLRLGLLSADQEWFGELSWDPNWHNLIGDTLPFVVSRHYVMPEEMLQLYYERQ